MQVKNKYLFATVPNSRINSWESWFIFNLHKNNNQAYIYIYTWCRFNTFIYCKRKFVFLDRQTINGNWRLLRQWTFPSMHVHIHICIDMSTHVIHIWMSVPLRSKTVISMRNRRPLITPRQLTQYTPSRWERKPGPATTLAFLSTLYSNFSMSALDQKLRADACS